MDPTPPRSIARHAGRLAWILALVFALGLAAAWITIATRGSRARARAIDRVRMANAALLPDELRRGGEPAAKDPSDWLVRVTRVEPRFDMARLSDPVEYRKLYEAAQRREYGEDGRVAFEEFHACMESLANAHGNRSEAWEAFWSTLAELLRVPDGASDWGTCPAAALRVLAVGLAPTMELAREAASLGPIDPTRVVRSLESAGETFPTLPVSEEVRLSDAALVTALAHANAREPERALDDLRVGLALARVHQPSHWLVSHVVWNVHVNRALDTLAALLPLLPRGLDLDDVESALTALRPRAELAVALAGERAFGNRLFEELSAGRVPGGAGSLSVASILERWHWKLVGAGDQALYLDALTAAIERAARSAFSRPAEAVPRYSAFEAPATRVVLPPLDNCARGDDVLEARLALARAALTAYRGGGEAAFRFLSTSVDPFDGRALRCAVSSEGLIAFWSVGPDRSDDGGKDARQDVVWRLRLRE